MDIARLWDAIRDRAVADTGSGGLFNATTPLVSGFYNTFAPTSATHPYCVYVTASATPDNGFNKDVVRVNFRIQSYVARKPANGADAMQVGSDILNRVYGDSSAGGAPTYGFARWSPTLAGSWTATVVEFVDVIEDHGNDYYCWVQSFRTHLTK